MIILLVLGIFLITFLLRSSFILFLHKGEFPPAVRLTLGLVPAAVLSALVWPDVFSKSGIFLLEWDKVLAAVVGVVIAWRTRNALFTVLFGMLTLWCLRVAGL